MSRKSTERTSVASLLLFACMIAAACAVQFRATPPVHGDRFRGIDDANSSSVIATLAIMMALAAAYIIHPPRATARTPLPTARQSMDTCTIDGAANSQDQLEEEAHGSSPQPQDVHDLLLRARGLIEENNILEAGKTLSRAASLLHVHDETVTEQGDALLFLARLLEHAGFHDDALDAYKEATRMQPTSEWAWWRYADSLSSAGYLGPAVRAYETATGLLTYDMPYHFTIWSDVAHVHRRAGDLEAARQSFEKALKTPLPDYTTSCWVELGGIHANQQETTKALDCWKRALIIDPSAACTFIRDELQALPKDQARTLAHALISMCGLEPQNWSDMLPRNISCPCGSEVSFDSCHGSSR